MHIQLAKFSLLGLLAGTNARSLAASRTVKSGADRVVARAPAIPTSTLITDFEKDGVPSSWAEGHPKVWGAEAVKFEGPVVADVSSDEKFLALASGTTLSIRDLSTQKVLSSTTLNYLGDADSVSILSTQGGGYDVFVGLVNYTTTSVITRAHFSPEGVLTDEQTHFPGSFSSFDGRRQPFSPDGKRLLALTGADWPHNTVTTIYDLENLDSIINLVGHTDSIMSAAFSPDGSLVSTAAWDSYGKVWDAATGELLHSFGPSGGQNWKTNFSPDGKHVIVANAGRKPTVKIYSVADFSAEPIVFAGFEDWIRTATWTSDSKLLAAGTYGVVQVYSLEEKKVIQRWEMEDHIYYESWDLNWIESDSGLKLAYRTTAGLEVYDFEANLKYRWGPDDFAQYDGGGSGDYTNVIKSQGLIGGTDADRNIRFYEFPI